VNIVYKFVRIVNVNNFYNVSGYSLPNCDLRLHAEYKYTIVQINTQHKVPVNQVFLVVALLQPHSPGTQFS